MQETSTNVVALNVPFMPNEQLQNSANNLLSAFDDVHLHLEAKVKTIVKLHKERKFPVARAMSEVTLKYIIDQLVHIEARQSEFVEALDCLDDLDIAKDKAERLAVELQAEIDRQQQQIDELQTQLDCVPNISHSDLAELREQANLLAKSEVTCKQLQQTNTELQNQILALESLSEKANQADNLTLSNQQLSEKNKALEEEVAQLKAERTSLSQTITKQSQEISSFNKSKLSLETNVNQQKKTIERLERKLKVKADSKKSTPSSKRTQQPSGKSARNSVVTLAEIPSNDPSPKTSNSFLITRIPEQIGQNIENVGLNLLDMKFTIMVSDQNGVAINCLISEWLTPIMPYSTEMQQGWNYDIEQTIHAEVMNYVGKEFPNYVKGIKELKHLRIEPFAKRGALTKAQFEALKKAGVTTLFEAVCNSFQCFVRALEVYKPGFTLEEYSLLFGKLNMLARLSMKKVEKVPLITFEPVIK
ncbi:MULTISPECIES: hypothetical protein [Vibrio harveyi group]|uniref:hypothetical protein n=1 Tax=Vibrio harveyi group TaxID=717610 RepID=UPI00047091DF|nr:MULTISPECIES: hypothetical protein [Vibrio harveyi group]MBO0179468.1 hypothetical protein [Vibrio parahaemolyticus]MDF5360017.1 hypothetical protein [Vibrio parahaemolyticus]MDG2755021.1 hypothetical protein [Vibrio parahaemolyticus]MDG2764287.1 hypothetical protein [Vibrio parahaemolyticus]QKS98514.1 hypothetical protein HUO05_25255 [Vibrio alginolyticus]